MPLYGRGWSVPSANWDFYSPASQPCTAGPYLREAGSLGYNEVRHAEARYGDVGSDDEQEHLVSSFFSVDLREAKGLTEYLPTRLERRGQGSVRRLRELRWVLQERRGIRRQRVPQLQGLKNANVHRRRWERRLTRLSFQLGIIDKYNLGGGLVWSVDTDDFT